MSVARRRWSPDEVSAIKRLFAEGYTYKQIGEKLRPGIPSAWRSIGDIVRERIKPTLTPAGSGLPVATTNATVQLHPSNRVDLPDSLEESLTAREMIGMLDDEQRDLFIATYEDLIGESDEEQVTRAEKEMLLKASFAHVCSLRAARKIAQCENFLMMDLDGQLGDSDADKAKKRMAGRADTYKKEYELYNKEYIELLQSLKMTRAQRLDKIKDTRNTLLDLQAELVRKARQESIVDEIKKINMATREEFERMARGEPGPHGQRVPWLIGAFDEIEVLKDKNDERKNTT